MHDNLKCFVFRLFNEEEEKIHTIRVYTVCFLYFALHLKQSIVNYIYISVRHLFSIERFVFTKRDMFRFDIKLKQSLK